MRISVEGELHQSVSSKDIILHIIGRIGTAGGTGRFCCSALAASEKKAENDGTGCVIEYAGSVIRNLSMEARMSIW